MKKTIFSALIMVLIMVSCNQKNKNTTTNSPDIEANSIMMNKDTIITENNSMMGTASKLYACPMHPEVQGKLNDKCSKCGMKLTELVPQKKQ
jgi:nitrous oxide reductase accessory protein NosL